MIPALPELPTNLTGPRPDADARASTQLIGNIGEFSGLLDLSMEDLVLPKKPPVEAPRDGEKAGEVTGLVCVTEMPWGHGGKDLPQGGSMLPSPQLTQLIPATPPTPPLTTQEPLSTDQPTLAVPEEPVSLPSARPDERRGDLPLNPDFRVGGRLEPGLRQPVGDRAREAMPVTAQARGSETPRALPISPRTAEPFAAPSSAPFVLPSSGHSAATTPTAMPAATTLNETAEPVAVPTMPRQPAATSPLRASAAQDAQGLPTRAEEGHHATAAPDRPAPVPQAERPRIVPYAPSQGASEPARNAPVQPPALPILPQTGSLRADEPRPALPSTAPKAEPRPDKPVIPAKLAELIRAAGDARPAPVSPPAATERVALAVTPEPTSADLPEMAHEPEFKPRAQPDAQPATPHKAQSAAPLSAAPPSATALQPIAASAPDPAAGPVSGQLSATPSQSPSTTLAAEARGDTRVAPQIENAIDQLTQARESARAARPELTLRHAEFGAVNVRLEAAGGDLRATLSARDPGFVPAIHAALADRAVVATNEGSASNSSTNSQRGHDQSANQNNANTSSHNGAGGQSEGRYGTTPGSSQGSPQPYRGQSDVTEEEGALQRDARRSRTDAGDARKGGLFA